MLLVLLYPKLSTSDLETIEGFRRKFEPDRAKLVSAHVTAVFPTIIIGAERLIELCTDVAKRYHSFPISFTSTRLEKDVVDQNYKIFLDVAQGAEIISSLHNDLYFGPHRDELRDDIPFVPHMTIATTHDEEVATNALAKANNIRLPIEATISSLSVELLSGGILTKLATIPLD